MITTLTVQARRSRFMRTSPVGRANANPTRAIVAAPPLPDERDPARLSRAGRAQDDARQLWPAEQPRLVQESHAAADVHLAAVAQREQALLEAAVQKRQDRRAQQRDADLPAVRVAREDQLRPP